MFGLDFFYFWLCYRRFGYIYLVVIEGLVFVNYRVDKIVSVFTEFWLGKWIINKFIERNKEIISVEWI